MRPSLSSIRRSDVLHLLMAAGAVAALASTSALVASVSTSGIGAAPLDAIAAGSAAAGVPRPEAMGDDDPGGGASIARYEQVSGPETASPVFLPALNEIGGSETCRSWIEVQNVGDEPTTAVLLTWSDPSPPDSCTGALKAECSGLIKPGASWSMLGAQVPTGSRSGALFTFANKRLSEIGVSADNDDLVGTYMCEQAFFRLVGDCARYAAFRQAYDTGDAFEGIPMNQAVGQPIAVHVLRHCPGTPTPFVQVSSAYSAPSTRQLGARDPDSGVFECLAPAVKAEVDGMSSEVTFQNTSAADAHVEVWWQAHGTCDSAELCRSLTVRPGESASVAAADCGAGPWSGSMILRSDEPLAGVVDTEGQDTLTTYTMEHRGSHYDVAGRAALSEPTGTLYGPLAFDTMRRWAIDLGLVGLGATAGRPHAHLEHPDGSRDVEGEALCAGGSTSLSFERRGYTHGVPAGSVRVSMPGAADANLRGVIEQTAAERAGGPPSMAAAYNLLPEGLTFVSDAESGGDADTGIAAIAVPGLYKDLDATGQTSLLAVANLVDTPGWTDVAIVLVNEDEPIDVMCRRLRNGQTVAIEAERLGSLPPGTRASAMVVATDWHHVVPAAGGVPARNRVGIGAAAVTLTGTAIHEDIPGDELAIAEGVPLRHVPESILQTAMSVCGSEPVPPPTATPRPSGPRDAALEATSFLPVLANEGQDLVCQSALSFRNTGTEPAKALLIAYGEPGFCPPQCAGPLWAECSGLIAPGATWSWPGEIPGAMSALVHSYNAKTLAEIGVPPGTDQLAVDALCELVFREVVGDCDDYRRYTLAFNGGSDFYGLPLGQLVGPHLDVSVQRQCPDRITGEPVTGSYSAPGGTYYDAFDEVAGGYWQSTVPVYADSAGRSTILYVQNAGTECTSVDLWFPDAESCLRARKCSIFILAPGEAFPFDATYCVGPDYMGGASLLSSQPLAVVTDVSAPGRLVMRPAYPGPSPFDLNGDGSVSRADVAVVEAALGSSPGTADWNERADLDANEVVDSSDVAFLEAFICSAAEPGPEPPLGAPERADQIMLPALSQLLDRQTCQAGIVFQNLGDEPAKAAIVFWGAPSPEAGPCEGPLRVVCTGLVRPGEFWWMDGSTVPRGAESAIAFSLTTKTLAEIMPNPPDPTAIAADFVCETLFFAAVGDCDDYARFKAAFDAGAEWAGIPLDKVAGSPMAATVSRTCPGRPTDSLAVVSAYSGHGANLWGRPDPLSGAYTYHAPDAFGNRAGYDSILYVQNGGSSPASASLFVHPADKCGPARACSTRTIQPGETVSFDLGQEACAASDWIGSALVVGTAPLGVLVESIGRNTQSTDSALPAHIDYDATGARMPEAARTVAYGAISHDVDEAWDIGVKVQNLDPARRARVRIEYLDPNGYPIQVLEDDICPGGAQFGFLPTPYALTDTTRVGSIRVTSQRRADDPASAPAPISAVATLYHWSDAARSSARELLAYNMASEGEGLLWPMGAGAGGTASGTGVWMLPMVIDDLDGSGWSSEISVANLVGAAGQTQYALLLYDQNGLVAVRCDTLAEEQVHYLRLDSLPVVPHGFRGSAVVSAVAWDHPVYDPPPNGSERNLVGLAAVAVLRKGVFGVDQPGDESGATTGTPLRRLSPAVQLPPGGPCGPAPTPTSTSPTVRIYLPVGERP